MSKKDQHTMSDDESHLDFLRKRYDICNYRRNVLNFELTARRFNSRLRTVLNDDGSIHLNDCARAFSGDRLRDFWKGSELIPFGDCTWAFVDEKEGPNACHCARAVEMPERYLKFCRECPVDLCARDETKFKSPSGFFRDGEGVQEFYVRRVLDEDGLFEWHDRYAKAARGFGFAVRVRESNKQNEIDAVLNHRSGEWHLTDCRRSFDADGKPNTCRCVPAMEDSENYLREKFPDSTTTKNFSLSSLGKKKENELKDETIEE